jgi:hypothetical protein
MRAEDLYVPFFISIVISCWISSKIHRFVGDVLFSFADFFDSKLLCVFAKLIGSNYIILGVIMFFSWVILPFVISDIRAMFK